MINNLKATEAQLQALVKERWPLHVVTLANGFLSGTPGPSKSIRFGPRERPCKRRTTTPCSAPTDCARKSTLPRRTLRTEPCRPNCSSARSTSFRTRYLVAAAV